MLLIWEKRLCIGVENTKFETNSFKKEKAFFILLGKYRESLGLFHIYTQLLIHISEMKRYFSILEYGILDFILK